MRQNLLRKQHKNTPGYNLRTLLIDGTDRKLYILLLTLIYKINCGGTYTFGFLLKKGDGGFRWVKCTTSKSVQNAEVSTYL